MRGVCSAWTANRGVSAACSHPWWRDRVCYNSEGGRRRVRPLSGKTSAEVLAEFAKRFATRNYEDRTMVKTASTMLELGTQAPDFSLPDPEGEIVSRSGFEGAPALLVVFMCNHCPFVIHLAQHLSEVGASLPEEGRGGGGYQLERRGSLPGRCAGEDVRRGEKAALYVPVSLRQDAGSRQGVSRRVHAGLLPVRRRSASSCTAASSIRVAQTAASRSREKISARRSTRSWRANRWRPSKSRASAATSSGRRVTNRTISVTVDRLHADNGRRVPSCSRRRSFRASPMPGAPLR